jgi:hypothetical protein
MSHEPAAEIDRRRCLAAMTAAATPVVAGCSWVRSRNGVGDSGATDVILHSAASTLLILSAVIT